MSDVAAGTVIDERYRVVSRIGSGGMADVYLAEDQLLGRQVALKVLQHRFVADEEFVERFRREASAAAGLSHPNVVAIFDRGTWNGTYYIAMEYLPGRTLKRVVREHGPLEPELAIDIAIQILHAASFAHRRGIVHRDIKPHNVILGDEGRVTVTDFGIARAGASDMTHTGSIMGTAQYLSPEQAQGQPVSPASDIYAVGVLLYELLTARVPFDGESAVAIALQHLSAEPAPPSAVQPGVPAVLDDVVLRALAKDPAQRFGDADEFIATLERAKGAIAAGEGGSTVTTLAAAGAGGALGAGAIAAAAPFYAATPLVAHEPAGAYAGGAAATGVYPVLPPPPAGPPDPEEERQRRRRRIWLLAGVAGLLLAAGAAFAVLELTSSQAEVTMPKLVGQPQATAVKRLRADHLVPVARLESSVTVLAGSVISQSPAPGSVVREGTRVYIAVSAGPRTVVVPKVTGLAEKRALATLRGSGLDPIVQPQPSKTIASGIVVSTNPPAGLDAQQGTPVAVYVSTGPSAESQLLHVPSVTGLSQHAAEETLRSAGFGVGNITRRPSSAQPPGFVVSQLPAAGSSLASGGAVSLVVAETPRELTMPNVVGQSETAAAATLGAAGLKPTSSLQTVTNPAENGVVLEQTPAAGQKVKRGAAVTIIVGTLGQVQTTSSSTTTPEGQGH